MIEIVIASKKYYEPSEIAEMLHTEEYPVTEEMVLEWLKQGWVPIKDREGKLILLEDIHVDGENYCLSEKYTERLKFLYAR